MIVAVPSGVFQIDPEDSHLLAESRWYVIVRNEHLAYVRGYHQRRHVSLHRVITDAPTGRDVDHINGDGLDNRRSNLRFCTDSGNQANQHKRAGALSRYKGVTKWDGRWRAQIQVRGLKRSLGYFDSEDAAAKCYDAAALAAFGPFARVNFPLEEQ